MPVDQIKRGMSGYGLSVFQGTQIDTFGVEILGVIADGIGPGHDLILARLSGANLEHTGIIRGMSGSPVYVDGLLVGAIAYGWSYSKDPIGGITPIGPMVDVTQRATASANEGPGRQSIDFSPAEWLSGEQIPRRATLERLATPVALSGFSGLAGDVLQQALAPLGMDAALGPGSAAVDQPVPTIEPGAGLGVQLISGDRNATAIGTLTWTDGERFVGFGHPMLHMGATEMPATSVYVHQIIPSQISSFKLGGPVQPFGTVRQDRQAGIGGLIGTVPAMVPVAVDLATGDGNHRSQYAVMRHRDLLPVLVRSVLISAMESTEKLVGDAALSLRTTVALRDGRRVEYDQFYSGTSAALIASIEAVQPLTSIAQSSFIGLDIDSVHFAADVREALALAQITGMRLPNAALKAGHVGLVEVTLQPYRSAPIRHTLELDIPRGTPPGPLLVRASSGESARQFERTRRPDAFVPRSGDDLLHLVQMPGRADELVIEVLLPEPGLTVHGREFPSLPPSARAVLESESSSGYLGSVSERVLLRVRHTVPYALVGEQTVEAIVETH